MDDKITLLESRVFGYLKRTVSTLVNSKCTTADAKNPQDRLISVAAEVDRSGPAEESRKRKQSFSNRNEIKKQKVVNSSIADDSLTYQHIDINVNIEGNKENSVFYRNSLLNQLLWTLKYLKYNPIKINDEMLGMVNELCEGLEKFVLMSRLNFTDMELRRFLRISDTLFRLIVSCEDDYCLMTMSRIRANVDNLFDKFLEHFSEQDSNAEEQLVRYGFISNLISQVKDDQILKRQAERLLLRVYTTTTVLWKACVSCSRGVVQVVQSTEINLFVSYCQLLEVLVTYAPVEVKVSVHRNLNILTEDAGSLFTLFPNLAFILYSTILTTGQNLQRVL